MATDRRTETERKLLGSILIRPDSFECIDAMGAVADWFSSAIHKGIYTAFQRCRENGRDIDAVEVMQELQPVWNEDVGLCTYLAGLTVAIPVAQPEVYAMEVRAQAGVVGGNSHLPDIKELQNAWDAAQAMPPQGSAEEAIVIGRWVQKCFDTAATSNGPQVAIFNMGDHVCIAVAINERAASLRAVIGEFIPDSDVAYTDMGPF